MWKRPFRLWKKYFRTKWRGYKCPAVELLVSEFVFKEMHKASAYIIEMETNGNVHPIRTFRKNQMIIDR